MTVAAGQTASVSFVGTVEEVTTAVTVTISSITVSGTAGATVVPAVVVGAIDVNLTVDEGTETITEAAVLLDGVVVGEQSFATGAPREDGPEGAVRRVTIQISTAACGPAPGTVCARGNSTPTFQTGEHVVSARITSTDGGGGTSIVTASQDRGLTFMNADALVGTLSSTTSAVTSSSVLWRGGSLILDVEPVLYSGRTLGSVVATLTTNNGAPPAPFSGVGTTTLTDLAAPWNFVFEGNQGTSWNPCADAADPLCGYQSAPGGGDEVTLGAVLYSNGDPFLGLTTIDGVAPPLAVLVDNVGPTLSVAGTFILPSAVANATTLCCNAGWVQSTFAFGTALGTTEDDDDAVPSAGAGVAGVGGSSITFHFAESTVGTPGVLGDPDLIALPSAATPAAAGLFMGLSNNENHVQAGLTDDLGNVSYVALAAGGGGGHPANTFGVDDTPPTDVEVTGVEDQTIYNAASGASGVGITFSAAEDVSGVSATPLSAWMKIDPGSFVIGASSGGGAINVPMGIPACGVSTPAPAGVSNCIPDGGTGPADGYYTFGGKVVNQAGGITTETVVSLLQDVTDPEITANVSSSAALTGGSSATFSGAVSDNLDLLSTNFTFDYGNSGDWLSFGPVVPIGDGVAFDGSMTTTASPSTTINLVAGLEQVTGADLPGGGHGSHDERPYHRRRHGRQRFARSLEQYQRRDDQRWCRRGRLRGCGYRCTGLVVHGSRRQHGDL